MKHPRTTETTESLAIFKVLPEDPFFKIMVDVHGRVARRAYEFFGASGFTHGHDLADWLQAESETLMPVHFEISETEDVISVRAALPSYDAKDIEIHVEPQRLFISGQQQKNSGEKKTKALDSVSRLEQIFQCIDLPLPVNPDKVTAKRSKGELRIELTKESPAKRIAFAEAAA